MNKFLTLAIIAPALLSASELQRIKKEHVLSSEKLSLFHDGESFQVKQNGRMYAVPQHDLDNTLRQVNRKNLAKYLKAGLVRVNKMNNGDYVLRSHVKGVGGGPISAAIGYWVTKSACYGALGAAATTVVVAPLAAPAALGVASVTGGMSAMVSAGATLATGLAVDAGVTAAAASGTVAVVSASGGVVGAMAAVESASMGVWGALMVCPFLP
jgi:hypothetical protein